ncbi:MAG: N-acetylmuramoyl-L-alanine amidase [Caulobacteraceae bacterium]|nr:N-acetylmuramoyl-L-alanine amidase [Caulobacteraceae bacterium]
MTWKGIVDRSFTAADFDTYCKGLTWAAWRPSFIVLHNTAIPSLAQRPDGLAQQHILSLEAFYRDTQGWSGGPHLFVDDRQIWAFTPLTVPGVHSPSWNQVAIGIEMLGDYAVESFTDGRGLAVQANAVAAMATLCEVLGLQPSGVRLHREDPKTTHKCPGKNVDKAAVIQAVEAKIASHAAEHDPAANGGG